MERTLTSIFDERLMLSMHIFDKVSTYASPHMYSANDPMHGVVHYLCLLINADIDENIEKYANLFMYGRELLEYDMMKQSRKMFADYMLSIPGIYWYHNRMAIWASFIRIRGCAIGYDRLAKKYTCCYGCVCGYNSKEEYERLIKHKRI